jgi:hypothetical protein
VPFLTTLFAIFHLFFTNFIGKIQNLESLRSGFPLHKLAAFFAICLSFALIAFAGIVAYFRISSVKGGGGGGQGGYSSSNKGLVHHLNPLFIY